MNFNLLATTYRQKEYEAASELFNILSELGDTNPRIDRTGISGLLAVSTELPYEAIRDFVKKTASEEPWRIRFLLRLIPIERVVESSVETIAETVWNLASKIGEDESFRISVERRHTSIPSNDVIKLSAERIDRKVDLNSPDWIVLIEIVGGWTGVSVVRPDDILSIVKIKRGG